MRKHPIPPIPSTILRMAKNAVDDINGDITPDDATNNTEIKNADLLPQLSAIIPNSKAPINIPTMYSALNIPFKNFLSQTKLCLILNEEVIRLLSYTSSSKLHLCVMLSIVQSSFLLFTFNWISWVTRLWSKLL